MDNVVCDRCSVVEDDYLRKIFIFFIHLKLEIVFAIAASNEWKIKANNSAGQFVHIVTYIFYKIFLSFYLIDTKIKVQVCHSSIASLFYGCHFRHEDAIPDFEAVLRLDSQMACAHVNLGLIYMLKSENYHRWELRHHCCIQCTCV